MTWPEILIAVQITIAAGCLVGMCIAFFRQLKRRFVEWQVEQRSPLVSARMAYISALGKWVLVIEERCDKYTRVHIHKLPDVRKING